MNKGKFIVFEGGEGSGKTTAIEKISLWLEENGTKFVKTREPGGIKISEQIREIILDVENKEMDGKTEALLYAAARRQHLVQKVIPALNEGLLVICDRFIYSSLAYQGHGRELGIDNIYNINRFAVDEYMPDLTIYFDIEPEVGLKRIKSNSEREVNRLDLEKLSFHHKVREGYKIALKKYNHKYIIIDASKSIEEIQEELKKILIDYIN